MQQSHLTYWQQFAPWPKRNVNVIAWPNLVEKQRAELLGASLLGVCGKWQSQSGVRHLVAMRLVDLSYMLGEMETHSRNFH